MVVVLGGGVGGLSATYYLLQTGKSKVLLAEASDKLGGWVRTIKHKKLGVLLETGPRTIRPTGAQGLNTLTLIDEMNLCSKVMPIKSDHPAARNRYVYINKKLHVLPVGMKSVFKKTPPFSKAFLFNFINDLFAPVKKCTDDSLYSFVERRLGKELADYAVSPMVCGICAGDAKEISVKFLMPDLFKGEQEHGSIIKGLYKTGFFRNPVKETIECSDFAKKAKDEKWNVWMLEGGLQTLTDTLGSNIKRSGADIRLNSACKSLKFENNKVIYQIGDDEYTTKHVISALPSNVLAPLLKDQHKVLAEELSSIKFVTVGVVNLVFKGNVLKENGFGLLVPPCEELPVLGVIFDSCCYQQGDDKTILTVMLGGKWFNKYFGEDATEEYILHTAVSQVKNILGVDQEPEANNVVILKNCIPQYVVGHYEKVDRIFQYIKDNKLPLSLVGSSYKGVGLNDVIMSSKKAVGEFVNTQ